MHPSFGKYEKKIKGACFGNIPVFIPNAVVDRVPCREALPAKTNTSGNFMLGIQLTKASLINHYRSEKHFILLQIDIKLDFFFLV